MLFHPRRAAERAFVPDPEGRERFHPLGAFGPSYAVDEPARRARLYALRFAFECAIAFAVGFLVFWAAYYRGPDDGMRFAPPLLVMAVGVFVYRLLLRWRLRGLDPLPNRWREAERRGGPWWELLPLLAYLAAAAWLGALCRGWL